MYLILNSNRIEIARMNSYEEAETFVKEASTQSTEILFIVERKTNVKHR